MCGSVNRPHTTGHTMLTIACLATLATLVAMFPRCAYAVAGIVGTVGAVAYMADAVAVAALIACVGMVAAMDGGTAPTAPGYLHRADVGMVVDAVPVDAKSVRSSVVFTTPVWDDAGAIDDRISVIDALNDRADHLLGQYSRAKKSRHQARAARYWSEYCATLIKIAS